MADTVLAVTNVFPAVGSVNNSLANVNFEDITKYIRERNDATATWDSIYVTTADRVPMRINNSTGANNIAEFEDNGTDVFVVGNDGASTFTAIDGGSVIPLTVNNGTSTGDILNLADGGTEVFTMINGGACTITANGGSGVPLTVNNGTSTGSIFIAQDGGSAVLTIADGGIITTTGAQKGADGSASACTYAFSGSDSIGLYRVSGDDVGINGVQILLGSSSNAGSESVPLLARASDEDTGFFWTANTLFMTLGGVKKFGFGANDFIGFGAGDISAGNATDYFNDISFKTLTDRGCLGDFTLGVEMQDGRIVPDTEALLEIKTHPSKRTIYGVPMFDYRTMPKATYKKAEVKGILLPRDANDEPIGGDDGAELTSLISIAIGAIRELTGRMKTLERAS